MTRDGLWILDTGDKSVTVSSDTALLFMFEDEKGNFETEVVPMEDEIMEKNGIDFDAETKAFGYLDDDPEEGNIDEEIC